MQFKYPLSQTLSNFYENYLLTGILGALLATTLLFSNLIPPFQSPDEFEHIKRAYLLSTGDIVHILNSDDVYANQNILTEVVDLFKQTSCEILLSKVKFFKQNNQINHKQNYTREVGIKFFSPNLKSKPLKSCEKKLFVSLLNFKC